MTQDERWQTYGSRLIINGSRSLLVHGSGFMMKG